MYELGRTLRTQSAQKKKKKMMMMMMATEKLNQHQNLHVIQ